MIALYNTVSERCSKITTQSYSTSFTMGIKLLAKKYHQPIYNIYGFVRFADEIVDTFHTQNQKQLLQEFKTETHLAIIRKISVNPILNAFQKTVNNSKIEAELYDTFLESMAMDLNPQQYNEAKYKQYILGSADVVGLMCLRVFCEGNEALYQQLKPAAMRLGSAFQKVNFLRDVENDTNNLGRMYFPDVAVFNNTSKQVIEADVEADFKAALIGIKTLPVGAKSGVYAAYKFYYALFNKIKNSDAKILLVERVRISDVKKMMIAGVAFLKIKLGFL